MKQSLLFLVFLPLFLMSSAVWAQLIPTDLNFGDTTQVHVVETTNDDRYVGTATSMKDTLLNFKLNNKFDIQIPLREITALYVKGGSRASNQGTGNAGQLDDDLEIWRNSGYTKAFFSSTAFLLPKGDYEYENTWLFYNMFNMGLGDHFNLEAGGVTLFAINVFDINAKLGTSFSEKVHGSMNLRLWTPLIFGTDFDVFGVVYPNATVSFGTREQNFSAGAGFITPFGDGVGGEVGGAFHLNAQTLVSDRVGFQGELFFAGDGIDMGGFSIIGGHYAWKRNRMEFNYFIPIVDGGFFAFPLIRYARFWQGKK